MALAYDFKLDENGDIYIDPITMDFVIAPSDQQHIRDILESVTGWWKEFPLVGLNVHRYLNGKIDLQKLKQEITIQLVQDGYTIGPDGIDIEITPDGILKINTLDASRN